MSDNALQVKDLYVNIGRFSLTEINISLKKGTITGFVGKNGAGKTSLIKTIVDIIPKAKGEILFFDKPLYRNEKEIKARLGIVFDSLIYAQNIKPRTLIKTIAPFYPNFSMDKFTELMVKFELDQNKKLNQYSKGMQMKFSIAMALSHNPDLLILDEPTSGLDPAARAEVLDLLYDIIQDEEKTIFFSTHITSDLDKIADSIIMIEKGKILFSEEKDKLLENNYLVHVDKEDMNDEIRALFVGVKENSFGYIGLVAGKDKLALIPRAKITKPSVEDIMIYRGEI